MSTIAIVLLLCSFFVQDLADGVLSKIDGLVALRQIVAREVLQDEIEIDPNQLDALVDLLNGDRLKTVLSNELPSFEGFRGVSKAADAFVRVEFEKILTPEQIARRRLLSVKREFVSPMGLFKYSVLSEFGVSEAQFEKVERSVAPRFSELTIKIPKIRMDSIAELRGSMSENSIRKFVFLFGPRFMGGVTIPDGGSASDLRIFKESSPTNQLRMSQILVLPSPISITVKQSSALEALERKQAIRTAQSALASFDSEVEKEMNGILRTEQIMALLRSTHESCLLNDFSILTRQECIGFLELPEDVARSMSFVVSKSNQAVKEARRKGFRDIFESGVESLPIEISSKIKTYFKGVWE